MIKSVKHFLIQIRPDTLLCPLWIQIESLYYQPKRKAVKKVNDLRCQTVIIQIRSAISMPALDPKGMLILSADR